MYVAAHDQCPWQHIICQLDCPEDEPDNKVVLDGEDEKDDIWLTPHDECDLNDCDLYRLSDMRFKDLTGKPTMHLIILCASRQIDVEAS